MAFQGLGGGSEIQNHPSRPEAPGRARSLSQSPSESSCEPTSTSQVGGLLTWQAELTAPMTQFSKHLATLSSEPVVSQSMLQKAEIWEKGFSCKTARWGFESLGSCLLRLYVVKNPRYFDFPTISLTPIISTFFPPYTSIPSLPPNFRPTRLQFKEPLVPLCRERTWHGSLQKQVRMERSDFSLHLFSYKHPFNNHI